MARFVLNFFVYFLRLGVAGKLTGLFVVVLFFLLRQLINGLLDEQILFAETV